MAKKIIASKENGKTSATSGSSDSKTQSEMKTSEIRDLIDFIAHSGLNEVDIETKELKLHVKREPDQKVIKSSPVMSAPVCCCQRTDSTDCYGRNRKN
jgi:acetyl-CoA carboxylase biotin carboxyl carrier protein